MRDFYATFKFAVDSRFCQSMWRNYLHGLARQERACHLCALVQIRAENAPENQKGIYRFAYRLAKKSTIIKMKVA